MTITLLAELCAADLTLVEVHLAQAADREKAQALLEARDGGPVSSRHFQRRFEEWLVRAGIRGRYSPHSLRHSFAMGLYQRTGDVLVVQAALGQRSVQRFDGVTLTLRSNPVLVSLYTVAP